MSTAQQKIARVYRLANSVGMSNRDWLEPQVKEVVQEINKEYSRIAINLVGIPVGDQITFKMDESLGLAFTHTIEGSLLTMLDPDPYVGKLHVTPHGDISFAYYNVDCCLSNRYEGLSANLISHEKYILRSVDEIVGASAMLFGRRLVDLKNGTL